nr:ATP-binding protein [Quadrisphaera setariae]
MPSASTAANLFFQVVAARHESGSLLIVLNLPFGRWVEVIGDDVVATAMIGRLVPTPRSPPRRGVPAYRSPREVAGRPARGSDPHGHEHLFDPVVEELLTTTSNNQGVCFWTLPGNQFSAVACTVVSAASEQLRRALRVTTTMATGGHLG